MTTICPDMEQAALSVPAQLLHRLIVRETLHGAEYPLVVHPPLEMPRDGRRRWPLIDHHIGVVPHAAQGVHPVKVLLVGAVVVRQHIDPLAAEVPDLGQFREPLEAAGQVNIGVIPREMDGLDRKSVV